MIRVSLSCSACSWLSHLGILDLLHYIFIRQWFLLRHTTHNYHALLALDKLSIRTLSYVDVSKLQCANFTLHPHYIQTFTTMCLRSPFNYT